MSRMDIDSEVGFSFEKEFSTVNFGDRRLNYRFQDSMDKLSRSPSSPIRSVFNEWSEAMGFYRLLENDRVNVEQIMYPHFQSTIERIGEHKRVLLVQDTSSLNFGSHLAVEGLGSIAQGKCANNGKGMFIHPAVAYTLDGLPLGILNNLSWSRKLLTPQDELWYTEQRKWFMGLDAGTRVLQLLPEVEIICVGDRECSSAELMVHGMNANLKFVYRSKDSRIDDTDGKNIKEKLELGSPLGKIVLEVPRQSARAGTRNAKAKVESLKRQAHLNIYSGSFKLPVSRSKLRAEEKIPDNLLIQAVLVIESNPPKGIEPIAWLLITDLSANTFAEALEVLSIYKMRWKIETFFKILKSGCRVERCLVQSTDKLSKMILLLSLVAWRLQYLQEYSRHNPKESCLAVLSDSEWHTLYTVINKTKKYPTKPPPVGKVTQWIAKLGGHLGRKNDSPPGALIIWRGWQILQNQVVLYQALTAGLPCSV